MAARILRLATRGSALALWQAEHVRKLVAGIDPDAIVELVTIISHGDAIQNVPLATLGVSQGPTTTAGVGVFTKEIQQAVLDGRADFAVHSLKDLPTEVRAELSLAAVPERGLPFDALISPIHRTLDRLPPSAAIATGSPRRRAQLLRLRPDLRIVDIRGNVDTRLRKVVEQSLDGLVLAQAGLARLGLSDRVTQQLTPPLFLPAPSQGALGIECRADNEQIKVLLAAMEDRKTRQAVNAERALLGELRAGCHVPVSAYATVVDSQVQLSATVFGADGQEAIDVAGVGPADRAAELGKSLARQLIAQGADRLLTPVR